MSHESTSPEPVETGSWPAAALLDALPDATAVVDGTGAIVAVNHAWRMFALDNGGDPAATGVGVNYLQVCTRSAEAGSREAAQVAANLLAVLGGQRAECDLEYACPSPAVGRWYTLRITPIAGPRPGALVAHIDVTRGRNAERALEGRAARDPLTGLANRAAFDRKLETSLRSGRDRNPAGEVGLLFLDLDRFDAVNTAYGRAAGDSVLQTVGYRLNRETRPQQLVARLEADAFAVLAPRTTSTELDLLAGTIGEALERPYLVHGRWIAVGAGIGTYVCRAEDSAAYALQRADEALYRARWGRRHATGGRPTVPAQHDPAGRPLSRR